MVNTFSSGKLTAHRHGTLFCTKSPFWYAHNATAALEYRLSVDSHTIQRSVSALSAACFCSQQTRFRLLYIAFDPLLGSPSEGRYCDRLFRSHCFVLTVSIHALVKTPGNHLLISSIMDYPSNFLCQSFSFKFLLRKYKKYILTPFGRTKTKLDNKRKSTHPSLDGC